MVDAGGAGMPEVPEETRTMSESVYKVIQIIGTSPDSWEKAAKVAVERASKSLRDLRVAEVVKADVVIEDGKVTAYRTKLRVSFKYEDD
jgi:dodecin